MYRYSPEHKNHLALWLSAALSILFVPAWLLPIADIEMLKPFLPSIRIGGLLALSAGVYLAVCHFFIKYLYELETDPQNDGELLLTITQIRGRRRMTVCRIGTADIERFEKLQRRRRRQKGNKPRGAKIYNYCIDLHPDAHIIVLRDDAECREVESTEAILFMPNEKMANLIKNACVRSR